LTKEIRRSRGRRGGPRSTKGVFTRPWKGETKTTLCHRGKSRLAGKQNRVIGKRLIFQVFLGRSHGWKKKTGSEEILNKFGEKKTAELKHKGGGKEIGFANVGDCRREEVWKFSFTAKEKKEGNWCTAAFKLKEQEGGKLDNSMMKSIIFVGLHRITLDGNTNRGKGGGKT